MRDGVRRAARPLAALALLGLSGCGSLLTEGTATLAGVTGAAAGAAITKNATIAAAVGLGVNSLANEGLKYVERRVHRAEQERIALAAGPLAPGAVGAWSVSHDIPIESDEHGQVVVSRELGVPGFRCKEIVFSVEAKERAFYTAMVCLDEQARPPTWRWATAEPATTRWGGLQ